MTSSWLRSRQPLGRRRSGVGAAMRAPNRVRRVEWDQNTDTLIGAVGQRRSMTGAFFTSEKGPLEFRDGECTSRWGTTASMSPHL